MSRKVISRLEANKEVRRVLVRHGVDTSKLQFSCHGKSMTLTGYLYKDNGQDLELSSVEVILQELARIGIRISCEISNWNIGDGRISKKASLAAKSAKDSKEAEESNQVAGEKKPVSTKT